MSQAEYARHRGITRGRVSQLVKNGTIRRTPKGKINVAKTDAALDGAQAKIVEAEQAAATVGGVTFTQARTMREAFAAKLQRLEYERRAGQLIEKADAQKQAFECARRTRDALLSVGPRVASLARAAESDFEAEQIITKEITAALENLAETLAV